MTHIDAEAIREIMESLHQHIEYDQLVNKLVEKNIISHDEVSHINNQEDQAKVEGLLTVLFTKDRSLNPLILKIMDTLKTPSPLNRRRTDQAIEEAASGSSDTGSRDVCKPERRTLSNADMSEDWELKNFLFDLSKDITTEEFNDMKDLMHGEKGFATKALTKMDRPMQFFKQLMQTRKLDAYNLHFLQALVRRIGRNDLNKRVLQFCLENNKKPVHFVTPSKTPENGYRYVKHHIEGGIEKLTHSEKERLRAEVASYLCVPPMFVFISGIEPTDSILITFMVPEEDVKSFIHIYMEAGPSYFQISVQIHIEGDELSFSEKPPSATKSPTTIVDELKHLLEKEQILERELADRDEKLVDLQNQLDEKEEEKTVEQYLSDDPEDEENTGDQKLELYKFVVTHLMDVMTTMQPRETKNGSLKLASASTLYRHLLRETAESCGNVGLLNKLLDTRVIMENMMRENTMRKMQEIIQMLTRKIEELTEVNGFLRMSGNIIGSSSSFLPEILEIQNNTRNLAVHREEKGLQINDLIGLQIVQRIQPAIPVMLPQYQELLSRMTQDLSKKDWDRLKTFIGFTDTEIKELNKEPNRLLELAVMREHRSGNQEELPFVLRNILAKIKKGDMVHRYFAIPQEAAKKLPTRRSTEKTETKGLQRHSSEGDLKSVY